MLSWLIIGGGLHGTYLSHLLIQRSVAAPQRLRVLDDQTRPLAVWRHRSANCGMTHLRSPATHNIDLGIMSLHHFVRDRGGPAESDFIPPYYRPRLSVFDAHCEAVIRDNRLDRLRLVGRARQVVPIQGGLAVETSRGRLTTERILLAVGMEDTLCSPPWALTLRQAGGRVHHLFDPDFQRACITGRHHRVAVVGGGISAAQSALALAEQVDPPVTLVSRHPLAESQFDFDPCWIGPKCLTDFYRQPYAGRRAIVDAARLPGTLPAEVIDQMNTAVAAGRVVPCIGDVVASHYRDGEVVLKLTAGHHRFDRLVLATGFSQARPGGRLVDRLIEDLDLPLTTEGYPVIDKALAWHPRIYVSGALAELQVGPCARNIVGVRNAGRLLLAGLTDTPSARTRD